MLVEPVTVTAGHRLDGGFQQDEVRQFGAAPERSQARGLRLAVRLQLLAHLLEHAVRGSRGDSATRGDDGVRSD